jgi:hypothetical protein
MNMLELMATFLWILLTGVAAIGGYVGVKRFVRRRLRFVDALHRPFVPLLAGAGAFLLALPVVGLLPIVGGATAALFGIGVGAGIAAGRRELKRLPGG